MKLICIGDSLTFGYGVRPSQRWTRLCAQETGWEIVNEGISGDTTGGMLVRLRALLADRDICVQRPLALLMGGANDIFFSGTDTGARANMGAMLNQLLSVTLFSFDKGEEISTHESGGDAFVTCLDGVGRITIDGKEYLLREGESIVMPARHPHAVYGQEPFKMLLVVVF